MNAINVGYTMELTARDLKAELSALTDCRHFCLAYSGGMDSQVLLCLLQQLRQDYPDYAIRAIHIDHGISPQAHNWQRHCKQSCDQWGIPFQAKHIKLEKRGGESLEALAREARYASLAAQLNDKECLLTAHHQDDQAETLLLQLLRGSGIKGLAAMPKKKPFANGELLRPLLSISRHTIHHYAVQQQLQWMEDDSNDNPQFDRNYLRQQIMPLIKKRWPNATTTISRSAKHCANANTAMEHITAKQLNKVVNNQGLIDLDVLRLFDKVEQMEILRHWIVERAIKLPSERQLEVIFKTVIASRYDAMPCFRWGQHEIRRYRYHLYLIPTSNVNYGAVRIIWNGENTLKHPRINDIKVPEHLDLTRIAFPAEIRFRQGGERLTWHGKTKTLKQLFQEWGIPPWERCQIPLLYEKNKLTNVLITPL